MRVHLCTALDPVHALFEIVLALVELREIGARTVERRRTVGDLGYQLGVLRRDTACRIVLLRHARPARHRHEQECNETA